MRRRKYKNYGSVPRNEFTTTKTDKINSDEVLGQASQSDDAQNEQGLVKLRTRLKFGRLRTRSWLSTQSTNGWRAESASQQDEAANEEHMDNDRKD